MLPKKLKPIEIDNLLRIGNNYDGGYIINKEIVDNCKNCISFGLGDNFSFEEELKKINPSINIRMYDHTVNITYLIKNFFFWLWHAIRYRKLSFRFMYLFKYIFFFSKKNNFHIKRKISKNSLNTLMNSLNLIPEYSILKIDIDGDEYNIIEEIKNFRFLALIIEFEEADKNLQKILDFIEENNKLKLIHVHANNFLPLGIKNIPQALELTFIDTRLIKNPNILSKKKYPIKGLDYPNNPIKKDIKLDFES